MTHGNSAVVNCQCGDLDGSEACEWSGQTIDTVTVEYIPQYIRSSHQAAGYDRIEDAGVYPANGAIRMRLNIECAERFSGDPIDGPWTRVVGAYLLAVRQNFDPETTMIIHTETDDDARAQAASLAEEWVRDGDYDIDGASVTVRYSLYRGIQANEGARLVDDRWITVEIEPDHDELARQAGATTTQMKCAHDWDQQDDSARGYGGTSVGYWEECRHCALERSVLYRGSQRNPGETEYEYEYHAEGEE